MTSLLLRLAVLAGAAISIVAAISIAAGPRTADVVQTWCPNYGQAYPTCLVPRDDRFGNRMITNDVTSDPNGKARFHFVADVSNSNWNHTGHAGPFKLGTGWNKAEAGQSVYQIMENGGGCAVNDRGTHDVIWGSCSTGAKASLFVIRRSGATIGVYATNTYAGHAGDGNQPIVLTARGFANPVKMKGVASSLKTDQHWAR